MELGVLFCLEKNTTAQCQFFKIFFLYLVWLFRETYVFETAIMTKVANFDFDSIDYLVNSYIF